MRRQDWAPNVRALSDRLAAESAAEGNGIDVHALVADAIESERVLRGTPKAIRSLTGLIRRRYDRLRDEVLRRRAARQQQDQDRTAALDRRAQDFADLWLELLRLTSQHRLQPPGLAYLLDDLKSHEFPELNQHLIARLRALGPHWPRQRRSDTPEVPAAATGDAQAAHACPAPPAGTLPTSVGSDAVRSRGAGRANP